jgi:hypothetical protein
MPVNYIGAAKKRLDESYTTRNVFTKIAYALQAIAATNIVLAEETVRQTAIKAEEWYGEPVQEPNP